MHAESDGTYGSRRVHAQLRREGREVNHKRIERLMRGERIQGAYVPAKRRRGGGEGVLGVDGVRVWPDLVKRDFQPAGPNELWCSDLKQIPTGEGVLHLASVLDCFSRRIVGWAMGPVADAPLVADALRMAVSQRRPGEGIVHHADRGCQFTAVTFGSACRAHGITQSNSRKGSPHDNAAKESFFASLEKERLRRRTFATHEQARSSVFQYIEEFYNRRRLHSTLGYRSPTRSSKSITSRSSRQRPPERGGLETARRARVRSSARASGLCCAANPRALPPTLSPASATVFRPAAVLPLSLSTQSVSTERGAVHSSSSLA